VLINFNFPHKEDLISLTQTCFVLFVFIAGCSNKFMHFACRVVLYF